MKWALVALAFVGIIAAATLLLRTPAPPVEVPPESPRIHTLPTPFGEVRVQADPASPRIVADCDPCRVEHPALAAKAVIAAVHAEGTLRGQQFHGTVRVGAVPATVDAELGATVTGSAVLDRVPIAEVVKVFAGIVPEAARAQIGGTLSATVTFRWPGDFEVKPAIEGFVVDGLVGSELEEGPFTFWGRDAEGVRTLARAGEGTEGWSSLPAIGPWLPAAVIATEDSGFHSHGGYDLDGMLDAAAANQDAAAIVRGGSTLTQQLAKNLFLDGERTYARKLRELLYAVEMERELGKRRIMELYLNVVEWGPAVRGARAAARAYFLKSPSGLLPEEAAFLAGILRNPRTAYRSQYVRGTPDMERITWILRNMVVADTAARDAAIGRVVRVVPP